MTASIAIINGDAAVAFGPGGLDFIVTPGRFNCKVDDLFDLLDRLPEGCGLFLDRDSLSFEILNHPDSVALKRRDGIVVQLSGPPQVDHQKGDDAPHSQNQRAGFKRPASSHLRRDIGVVFGALSKLVRGASPQRSKHIDDLPVGVSSPSTVEGGGIGVTTGSALPTQPFPGLLEVNHVFRIWPPAPVRQDTPASLINGNEVSSTIHVNSLRHRHPQGDDGDAKCLVCISRENFTGKMET
jgi:hypothetical protein